MSVASVTAALRVAVEKEEQARVFYAGWAARVRDPGAAALLRELAQEEVSHKERLERGLPLAGSGAAGPAPASLGLADTLVGERVDASATTQDVLVAAMHREERARQMYLDLARWVADAGLRDLLNVLAGEEARHKARLEALYDDLVLTDN